jgi:hypothetical protein
LFWSRVLFTSYVLLPGEFLRGFAPFGADPNAPWNLLRWDSLGQYYPWRLFTARQLGAGLIPLWNPHEFTGAPFVANGQSAVFYPLNLPFWLLDTARAFGVSAWLHSLLACLGTYALAQRWKLSRAASVLSAIIFGFGGYLTTWVTLPTLSNTASWLPLLILLFERGAFESTTATNDSRAEPTELDLQEAKRQQRIAGIWLSLAFACTLLAGHAQVFVYCGMALFLRSLLTRYPWHALWFLARSSALTILLAAIQIIPTLELARNGHRAVQGGPSMGSWNFVKGNALPVSELPTLLLPGGPALSYSENFGYVGVVAVLLAGVGTVLAMAQKRLSVSHGYALGLGLFGLLYALATPLAMIFYFTVPGLSQMGGTGRAFLLWNGGIALLAAFGLDTLRRKAGTRASMVSLLALLLVTGELFAASWNVAPTAPRETIYPDTELTRFLQQNTKDGSRVLFITPRRNWLPGEDLQPDSQHPAGILPPNGAMVYGLSEANGYDSLAPLAYRRFVAEGEGGEVAPKWNGNMTLLENADSLSLDQLRVRWVASLTPLDAKSVELKREIDGVYLYERAPTDSPSMSGADFSPGWRNGRYQPESFRLGSFLTLCALAYCAFSLRINLRQRIIT